MIDGREADRARARDRIVVALADDHPVLRRTLRRLNDGEPDMKVIAEATELRAALSQLHREPPDVVVLDARMSTGHAWNRSVVCRAGARHRAVMLIRHPPQHGMCGDGGRRAPARSGPPAQRLGFRMWGRFWNDITSISSRMASPRA